ncbi:tripartite motif-containing protein 16-like protein isoform X2 [Perca fluviatilis]|uniref:tripartite motif-containing protein 16-like protein isoform X2 n=1 Tax=Perca fluviatilis TaxID=8168 RepID=UPI001965B350|nr:tripartite motif-containing protein 16-like protein isoform X2 [Perca fluviatilis]
MAEPHIPGRMNRLCCPICDEVLRNPTTITCGHKFCMQCIQDHFDCDERANRLRSCPECGHKFPSRPQLIRNTPLADSVKVRVWDTARRDAASEKRKHSEASKQAPKRARSCAETQTSSGSTLCVRHSSPLDIYCCTEEQIICAVCAQAEHSGHTIGSVREERRRKQEELKNIQTKSRQILQKQEKKWENMGKIQIQEEARETQDYCESVLAGVIDSLQRHYMSVRELIRGHEEEAAAQVEKMEEMRKRDAELNRLTQIDSDVHFLQKSPSLRRLCEKEPLHFVHEVSEDPLLPFKFIKRAVDHLGKQLEEFCDKEFALISQTANVGEQQESEGETEEDDVQQRWEASQSHDACGLSLDPTTAHEDLVIYEGNKEVRMIPLQCKSQAIRHPERFIHRRQVLCREGLQAERCYYEIEVEGDKAEIALTYKGIDRKSRTALSAFGGNAKSWSLDRSTIYSVSHRADSIQLTSYPSQRRLGVYLKFKEGTLSFYEVSDSMTFLYKVEAKFTEPLYPGFWLGEKCRIRICDLKQDRL